MIVPAYTRLPTAEPGLCAEKPADDAVELADAKPLQHAAADGGHADACEERRFRLAVRSLQALVAVALVLLGFVLACCALDPAATRAWVPAPLGMLMDGFMSPPCDQASTSSDSRIAFGLGIADITGPIVETNMMGYAALPQTNTGLAYRSRSRAFIVGAPSSPFSVKSRLPRALRRRAVHPKGGDKDPSDGQQDRWVFVNSDLCMGDTAIRRAVVERLREELSDVYGERNFGWSGTHSHSGPGGFINALVVQTSSKGIVQQNFDAIVEGTVLSILRAHSDFESRAARVAAGEKTSLRFGNATVREAHINRSKYSYLQNPKAERDRYDSDQDDEFAALRFQDGDQKKGLLSWYAVHGTSLYENNTLTSGDNKGLAAIMVEQAVEPDSLPGKTSFIAGMAQASVGDTTPNTGGAWCDSGETCDFQHSTCANPKGKERVQTCHGRGPTWGRDELLAQSPTGGWDWSGNQVTAKYQADAALDILGRADGDLIAIEGEVRSVKWNVAMGAGFQFALDNGTVVTTCPAALGYGFAGGTTDGPGAFDFSQGTNDTDSHNPFWDVVRTAIKAPSAHQVACQSPKRVLLSIGEQHYPYDWGPGGPDGIVETQILRAGNLFLLVVPGEFTTMAGRRIKERAAAKIAELGLLPKGQAPIVVLSGPANTYSHYITTIEEYSAQRYEGGSTVFGPHTLDAYIYIYTKILLPALRTDDAAQLVPPGRLAPSNVDKAYHFGEGKVVYDSPGGLRKNFGDVITQPEARYSLSESPSGANVTVAFIGANPRNDLRLEGTYLEVQVREADGSWRVVRTDGHASTLLRWTLTSKAAGSSRTDIAWLIEPHTPPGTYRIVYRGNHKQPVTGRISEFEGISNEFEVAA